MRNKILTDAKIKETKSSKTRKDEWKEHEREPEIDIKRNILHKQQIKMKKTEINTKQCEYKAES